MVVQWAHVAVLVVAAIARAGSVIVPKAEESHGYVNNQLLYGNTDSNRMHPRRTSLALDTGRATSLREESNRPTDHTARRILKAAGHSHGPRRRLRGNSVDPGQANVLRGNNKRFEAKLLKSDTGQLNVAGAKFKRPSDGPARGGRKNKGKDKPVTAADLPFVPEWPTLWLIGSSKCASSSIAVAF